MKLKRIEEVLRKHNLIMKARYEKHCWQVELSRGAYAAYGRSMNSLKDAITDAVANAEIQYRNSDDE